MEIGIELNSTTKMNFASKPFKMISWKMIRQKIDEFKLIFLIEGCHAAAAGRYARLAS